MNIRIVDTDKSDPDFIALTKRFDEELNHIYGEDVMKNYNPHNALDGIFHAVVIYCDGEPSACGGIKRFDDNSVEIKRIFVLSSKRKLGLGELVMQRLEELAITDGYKRAVLETADDMLAAQALYQKHGFKRMKNYGPYANDEHCVCMEKTFA
jgi:ribosomal protein S18 acetylase RimI-like enzyme